MSIGILVYGKKLSQKFLKGLLLVQFYAIYILMTFSFLSMRDFLSMDRPLSVCALYSALFLCTFSVFHCVNLYFFMLHFFHVALFSCSTFFILHHFQVALFCVVISSCCTFFCCTLFMQCTISCCTVTCCNVFGLHPSLIALFACCRFFLLHYFQRCSQDPHKHLRWRVLRY